MTRQLELADIQGNVVRAYGRYNYPVARYFFLHIDDAFKGRKFVEAVRHLRLIQRRMSEMIELI